ncbi:amidohydrolase [Liquorilactobacillus hordei]|uniref:amidohydrolase n=1 Tax=Liquorilactobacillus hordei TaxID=468911 RepID=UPI001CBF91F0|nr:amidohydrolase [Liquorilactobacillus hordei]MBZ2406763.1 peptidase [Liquorilactobacillus hordei]
MTKEKIVIDLKDITELRHYFHQYPELSNNEVNTTKKIKEILTGWGVSILPTSLNTGLLAEIKGKQPGAVIALRADIDALPVQEKTNLTFKSLNSGVMHACGHDLHLTSLLGAIKYFKDNQEQIKGTIQFLFQPAEEAGGGAEQVIEKKVLKDVKAILGFHNNPNLPVGTIALQSGPMMAGCYKFEVTIKGQGSHGAKPEKGRDPIIASTEIVGALQTIVSRNVNPQDAVVVSVTNINAGSVWNVIPSEAYFQGTVRLFDEKNAELVKQRLFELVEGIAKAYGQSVEIDWSERALPINNDSDLTRIVINSLSNTVHKPLLSMAGEDFATYQKKIPGVFAFIGSNGSPDAADWHEPNFVGLDETLKTGVNYFIEGAQGLLEYLSEKVN